MPLSEDQIQQHLERLLDQAKQPEPNTRRILSHLDQIETAISRGVSRLDLAETFELSVQQFTAALAGARRLHRQGGDRRLAGNRTRSIQANNEHQLANSGIKRSSHSLIEKL